MHKLGILLIGLVLTLTLSGCIGENYNFNPPALTLSSDSNLKTEDLAMATIDWRGEENKQLDKETPDVISFALEQEPMTFRAGEKVDLLFEHSDFETKEIRATVWHDNQEVELDVHDISFSLPKDEGDYALEVNLTTDRGTVQYVGNLNIIE